MYGFSLIKVAKWTNFVIGVWLIFTVFLGIATLNFLNPFWLSMSLYEAFFGVLIMLSSCNLKLIKENFLFLMTGSGKGCFNIFVGSLLGFMTDDNFLASQICGYVMIGTGFIFLFLSCCKNVS